MLAELFDKLTEAAGLANERRIFRAESEPGHNYYVKDVAGNLHLVTAQAPPEQSQAFSLADLARRVMDLEPEGEGPDVRPDVWYSRGKVIGSIGVRDPRRFISFKPEITPQFRRLVSLGEGREVLDQKQALRLLRIDLDGVGGVDEIAASIATVRFNHAQEAQGEVTRGRASMGQSARSELAGVERVPDKTALRLPVFSNVHGTEYDLRIVVDIDLEGMKFRILPLPGEIERAYQFAESTMRDQLRGCMVDEEGGVAADIYYGMP